MMIDKVLLDEVLGRSDSFFKDALQAQVQDLRSRVAGARILVIGAGGSIGGALVRVLAGYRPAALHLVDLSENSLVRLVRNLHSERLFPCGEFATLAIGFDELEFRVYLDNQPPFNYILNFAALKHVRSERDRYTAMRLLRVNVIANHHLLQRVAGRPPRRFFCVSSDKAVNPASLMGASKAFMERVCLAQAETISFSSARFANVAFSDGSLPLSFLERLEAGQPLAGPSDVRRYFISEQEAGELCLLACFVGCNREVFTPEMIPTRDLKSFTEIADIVLRQRGFKPVWCQSETEACERARRRNAADAEYPCHFAPSNTAGEKPFEEFYATDEIVEHGRLSNLAIVTRPREAESARLAEALNSLETLRAQGAWSVGELLELVRSVVPEFEHVEGETQLDRKM